MSAPLTLYLIRHGEVFNPQKILYGRMPNFGLSETGIGQASSAGQALADIALDAIYVSPMERAQQTAGLIARAQKPPRELITHEDLNEIYTPYDGTSQAELEKIHFDIYKDTQPPYEQPQDVRTRLLRFVAEVRQRHAGQKIAAVSHGDIVVAMFMYAKGQPAHDIGRKHDDPPERTRLLDLGLPERYPATASINKFVFHTSDPAEIPEYSYLRPY